MPRYEVTVQFTQTRKLKVFARSEDAAKEKAAEICEDWRDVKDVEAMDAEEIDE